MIWLQKILSMLILSQFRISCLNFFQLHQSNFDVSEQHRLLSHPTYTTNPNLDCSIHFSLNISAIQYYSYFNLQLQLSIHSLYLQLFHNRQLSIISLSLIMLSLFIYGFPCREGYSPQKDYQYQYTLLFLVENQMQINKISQKIMLQGVRTGSDLKKIVFCPIGQYVITISRTLLVKLWDVETETLIKDFKELIAYDGIFTPDSKGLILTGPDKFHFYSLVTNQEILRQSNGINLGGGEFSPDNLFYAYSNNSNLYVRQLNDFSISRNTKNTSCNPTKVTFDIRTNNLYTLSEPTGIVCKWDIHNLKVERMVTLNTLVSDIDFTNLYLVISSNKNRRQIYFLNLETLETNAVRIVPKANFLDVNTEIHSTYAQQYSLIFSVAIPGDYLFMLNATTLQFMRTVKLPINTYTVAYEPQSMILAIGAQVANKETNRIEDQIVFYQIQRNCSQIANTVNVNELSATCTCMPQYFWMSDMQICTRLNCLKNDEGVCKCKQNERWNNYTLECEWDCRKIKNSFHAPVYGLKKYCPCEINYQWESSKCRKLVKCQNVEFSISAKDKFECNCQDNFAYDIQLQMCIFDCSKIKNTKLGEISSNNPRCDCIDKYQWIDEKRQCIEKGIVEKGINIPIVGIVVPVAVVIILIIIGVLFCRYWRKVNHQAKSVASTNSNQIVESGRVIVSDSNQLAQPGENNLNLKSQIAHSNKQDLNKKSDDNIQSDQNPVSSK